LKIRNKTYKDFAILVSKDPVSVNLCTQKDLDLAIEIPIKENKNMYKKDGTI
jgi:hypothetical protein